jgi:hypothetical protein
VYLDLVSIAASILAYFASSSTFIRSFRLIRVLRVVNNIPALRRTLATVAGALEQIGNVVLLMIIVFVMFAVLCVIPHPHSCISFPRDAFPLFYPFDRDVMVEGKHCCFALGNLTLDYDLGACVTRRSISSEVSKRVA